MLIVHEVFANAWTFRALFGLILLKCDNRHLPSRHCAAFFDREVSEERIQIFSVEMPKF